MKILIVIHDAPYGSEKPYQALRLAEALLRVEKDLELTVYLTADGVLCAKQGQITPNGYYNIERLLKPILQTQCIMICKTCMETRGLKEEELAEGVLQTRLGDLAQLTFEADKVLIY
ncbi:MAG: DsrE family protein [Candidatus Eisenbacteria bacterium]|uniref:DsrE family protein n=1 Tax=Eiseniibacteriota bacterium TaxID=2212470 RepID=A0A948W3E4_UNCEI|nr:DsrE family protein [Candidatus Eisenbacteria bacterium]MBU1950074.1 DsrE family protein [Candidatus Eisenbacteria bacterium]MBU2690997.1 DsrE family protein [Candidatus Eisenbacteria bacterium]